MAQVIERVGGRDRTNGAADNMVYPWQEWLDGRAWRIKQGQDYKIKSNSMVASIYQAAKRRGLLVRVHLPSGAQGRTVEFQAYAKIKDRPPRSTAHGRRRRMKTVFRSEPTMPQTPQGT